MGEKSGRAANYLSIHLANPFLILELPAAASPDVVERKGELLLSLLAAAVAGSGSYQSPFGPRERTPEMVREALAELRDPDRRLVHEWWMLNGAC
jgi:hypothetical protein